MAQLALTLCLLGLFLAGCCAQWGSGYKASDLQLQGPISAVLSPSPLRTMAQATVTLCLLGLFLEGCYAQVTQPPTASVSLGGTVRLSCTLGGSYTVSSNRVLWLQQKPGNAPRFLLYFFTESNKGMGSGVPSRFSGSRSGSDKEGYLTISGAVEEDDADYYCTTWTGSACTVLQGCREVGQEPPTTCASQITRPYARQCTQALEPSAPPALKV
ncbi:hypothetical protein Y1Q_0022722 [Alligator mississippiensis]|uniref:Ig-like domain-containing protein n=1 Tax=Alligator mississippiensis TaxID=8496 RepID=A0A151N4A7_ALLMI|nr:hypothetical protein Y1Q_0022722 [Alligator mississippiensis]